MLYAPWVARNPKTRRWEATSAASSASHPDGVQRAAEVANFVEDYLWIAPKDGPLERIRLNSGQAILQDFLAKRWGSGLPALALVPKARQLGVSTWCQAVIFAVSVLSERKGRPYRAVTIAHIEETAKSIFGMTRLFEKRLPREWRLPLNSLQQGCIEWEGGSKHSIVSAKLGDAAGKGSALNAFHGSEVANWADLGQDPSKLWSSTISAIPNGRDTIVLLESTCKGRDPFFHAKIDASTRGKFHYPTVFLPWFLDTEQYAMTWESYVAARPSWDLPAAFVPTNDEILLRESLALRIPPLGQEWCVWRHELTDEQLIWRRSKIEEIGDYDFKRYFPSTLEEAWSQNEKCFVPAGALERMWTQRRAATRGHLSDDGKFTRNESGLVHRWAEPLSGHDYVIGADVSEGLTASDFQAAYVIDRDTHKVAAKVQCKIDPEEFAGLLVRLGHYYNDALLAIENNHNPSVIADVRKRGYPSVYWHKDPDKVRGRPPKPGFSTNKRTRPVLVTILREVLKTNDLEFNDEAFIRECGTFIWHEQKQHWAASGGNTDDLVMAMGIAVYVCGWRFDDGRRRTAESAESALFVDTGYEAWKREGKKLKALARAQRAESGGGSCKF